MYFGKSKEEPIVQISTPEIKVSGLSSRRHYVPVQNGTGVISEPEGFKITFVGPVKPEVTVIEIRESLSNTGCATTVIT